MTHDELLAALIEERFGPVRETAREALRRVPSEAQTDRAKQRQREHRVINAIRRAA